MTARLLARPMLSVIILICSLSTSPADCNDANALEVMNGGEASTVAACTIKAQQALAKVSVRPVPGREYAKVRCARKKQDKA